MAEAPGSRQPLGYDEDFVTTVDDDFECLICHFPMKEPVQTRCGHRCCKECLEENFRRLGVQGQPFTCPADRERLNRRQDVFPDKATERKILSLAIRCPSEGCDWTGELRSKEIHLASCLFKLVSCTNENCNVTVQRKDLEQHVTITCQLRIIECEHCNEPHPHCQMQAHIAQCSKFPVTCPNKCGCSAIARERIPNHTENDCPLTIISCPYEQMGCEVKVQRNQVESHLQSAVTLHLDLACVNLNKTEDKLYDTEVKLNKTEVKLNNTEAKLTKTEVALIETDAKLTKTEETTRKLMQKLDTLERRFEENVIKDQENVIKEKKVMVKKDTCDFSRMFVWKINNFSEILAKMEEKDEIESDPFYTASDGYKLKVQVYPNGLGSGKNTHLSVFNVVMKGEYDAILPWPFKNNVKFTLIDQQEDPVKRENITKQFIPGNFPEYFARPTKEENTELGDPEFISHKKLHSRPYIVDDTLFLQVEVGPLSS